MAIEQVINLFNTHQAMQVVVMFFLVNATITGLEIVMDLLTKKERRWGDTAANWFIFFAHQVVEKSIFAAIGFIALLPFYILTPIEIPITMWTWVLALLAADFTYYWMHRLEHEHRILWAVHSVHHSSEDFNLTVAFRLSVVEHLFEWVFLIPMILLGFNPFQALVAIIFIAQYQHWVHTEHVSKLGWLDDFINTPSVHRVHHGSNRAYLDKNYAGIFLVWDKLFGTYAREEEKVVYGLTRNINTNNPIKITFIEFVRMWGDLKQCRNTKDKLKIMFGGLSWRPHYFVNKEDHSCHSNSKPTIQ